MLSLLTSFFAKKRKLDKKNNYMYPEEVCTPMREELTSAGFQELRTVEQVDEMLNKKQGQY